MLHTLLSNFAPLMAIVAALIGTAAMLYPSAMSKKFGIPTSGPALPYLVSVGARDLFMGLALFVLWWHAEWRSLAWLVYGVGVVAISDFITVYRNGDKRVSAVHLSGAIIAFAYATLLLGQ